MRLAIEGRFARVTVSDDGDGIAADLLAYLFDPFRQGDGSASKGGLGAGDRAAARRRTPRHDRSAERRRWKRRAIHRSAAAGISSTGTSLCRMMRRSGEPR